MANESYCVVGLGNIAKRHRKNLKILFPLSVIISVSASGRVPKFTPDDCDYFAESISDAIKKCPRYAIIASPSTFHADHAAQFIRASIPILIEKPLTSEYQDAHLLEDVARDHGTPVAVGYCLRFMPSALRVKALLQAQVIGKIFNANIISGDYLPNWRPSLDYKSSVSASKKLGGGVLLELSHEFDYVLWLLGDMKVEFSSLSNSETLNIDVEAVADVVLKNADNVICYVHLDFLQSPGHRYVKIIGEKGRLDWDITNNRVELITRDGRETKYSDPGWDRNEMYLDMLREFDVYLLGNESDSLATIKDGLAVVKMVNDIRLLSEIR